jgi:YegS/Rv2252/BmrU family lipid kinase
MRMFLVVNPRSANGATGKRWAELGAAVGKAIGDFGHAFTEGPMHAAALTRKALEEGYECIVAVGGDGTTNEVVNGFFQDGKPIRPEAALGVLARGTGGDFRRAFGWGLHLDDALARLQGERTEPLDVGLVEFTAHSGERTSRYFVNVCSFGVSGLVVKTVNEHSKALGGKLSFMLASTRALMKYSDKKIRCSVDGGPMEDASITTLAVANGQFFGGGMKVAPDASTRDGVFDVTVWSGYGLVDFVLGSGGVYSGEHVKWKGTRTLRCKTLIAESEDEVLLDIDGEQPGRLPCRITILPAAIRLKV